MNWCCTTTDENAVAKSDKLQFVEMFAIYSGLRMGATAQKRDLLEF